VNPIHPYQLKAWQRDKALALVAKYAVTNPAEADFQRQTAARLERELQTTPFPAAEVWQSLPDPSQV